MAVRYSHRDDKSSSRRSDSESRAARAEALENFLVAVIYDMRRGCTPYGTLSSQCPRLELDRLVSSKPSDVAQALAREVFGLYDRANSLGLRTLRENAEYEHVDPVVLLALLLGKNREEYFRRAE